MAKQGTPRDQRMRQRLTLEAARIMVDEGVRNYYQAKRKAAERLGAPDTQNMPRNREIQDAVIDYQRLFQGESQAARLRELRETACAAMRFFARFRPRLVGSVLDGTAGEWSDVNLHVFADTPEELDVFLLEHGIPFEPAERRLRFKRDEWMTLPSYHFMAGTHTVDLTVFTTDGLRQPPLSQVDGQPMARANVQAVEDLLAGDDEWPSATPLPSL
ncbi:hypothetical protein [Aquisalimonas sp.]|uniref:hypothetical protein n=1 Tax=Aquisalimonas sp. TaxID=1872621 RepID=UPI0025C6DB1F|nr:hypothetical protein [Aquisalimonas sp.]